MSIITRLTFPLVAAAALVMSPMNSHASATDDAVTTSGTDQLKVYTIANGRSDFSVIRSKKFLTGTGFVCPGATSSTEDLRISTAHPGHQRMVSALLSAALSQRPYTLSFEATGGVCWVKQVLLVF